VAVVTVFVLVFVVAVVVRPGDVFQQGRGDNAQWRRTIETSAIVVEVVGSDFRRWRRGMLDDTAVKVRRQRRGDRSTVRILIEIIVIKVRDVLFLFNRSRQALGPSDLLRAGGISSRLLDIAQLLELASQGLDVPGWIRLWFVESVVVVSQSGPGIHPDR
jgi:hypothetical protein